MSDIIRCCQDGTIDDIALLTRGLELARGLFSNPRQYGPYAKTSDRFFWSDDAGARTMNIVDWTERGDAAIYGKPTVYVNTDSVDCSNQAFSRDVAEHTRDGSSETLVYIETTRLVFRVVSEHGHEARILGRILLNHLQGMRELLPYATQGQVHKCRAAGKTAPFKLRHEHNTDNRWAVDVNVDVQYELKFIPRLIAPVISEITIAPTPSA